MADFTGIKTCYCLLNFTIRLYFSSWETSKGVIDVRLTPCLPSSLRSWEASSSHIEEQPMNADWMQPVEGCWQGIWRCEEEVSDLYKCAESFVIRYFGSGVVLSCVSLPRLLYLLIETMHHMSYDLNSLTYLSDSPPYETHPPKTGNIRRAVGVWGIHTLLYLLSLFHDYYSNSARQRHRTGGLAAPR